MPKIIELTVEFVVQRVSCPGVWLCQDGAVSLLVFALGTSFETCMLPPIFPLTYNDRFYFRKRFEETCAMSNVSCLLKDETLYCELVQWCSECSESSCHILAQYLGHLSEVLFPPNICASDGVDLLMKRSKKFPGILSPKIEIVTKVRIDEVWNNRLKQLKNKSNCHCTSPYEARQKPVCHTQDYHRKKCALPYSAARSRSRSCTRDPASCSSLRFLSTPPDSDRICKTGGAMSHHRRGDTFAYNVELPKRRCAWLPAADNSHDNDDRRNKEAETASGTKNKKYNKILLESRYIDDIEYESTPADTRTSQTIENRIQPCVCDICKRYHDLFPTEDMST